MTEEKMLSRTQDSVGYIIFNNPESNNEISQIKTYFKFPLTNKVFKCASLCIILYKEQNL